MRSGLEAGAGLWRRVKGCRRGRIQYGLGRVREVGHQSGCRRAYFAVFVGGWVLDGGGDWGFSFGRLDLFILDGARRTSCSAIILTSRSSFRISLLLISALPSTDSICSSDLNEDILSFTKRVFRPQIQIARPT